MDKRTAYIAGPMRRYPKFNFPAFDVARDLGLSLGWNVISPADLDRANGVNENTPATQIQPSMSREFATRDVAAILKSDAIAMLPGFERSVGALAELALARWIHLDILDATTFKKLDENILDEAKRITRGDRNEAYGCPLVEHKRIGDFWSIYLGVPITAEQVAMMMVLLKVARMGHAYRRDSLVDIAGYADCAQRIHEKLEDRERS